MTELRPQIFFFLKSKGPSTVQEIIPNIPDYPSDEVEKEIGQLVKDGLLKLDDAKNLHICLYLDAPKIADRSDGLYDYKAIQEKKQIDPAQSRPPMWINENVYSIARRDQGERGTCVGQATAYAADLNAIKLTPWRPDLKATKRNDIVDIGNNKFIKDTLPPGSSSAECAYVLSRKVGNIRPEQLGSFLDFSIKSWQKQGICTDSLWWTPKSATFDNNNAYPSGESKAINEAQLHTIEGYASTKDFEAIKDAIYNNGFVLMAINVFDNWTANNCEGLFPEPNKNVIGSHALCWVGYDENNLYCLHSWTEWSLLGGISRNYFNKAAFTAFVPLDTYEVDVAKTIYKKLVVTSDILCNIKINNDTFRKTYRAVGAFDPGTTIVITATPNLVGFTEQTQTITITEDTVIQLKFLSGLSCMLSLGNIKEKLISLWRRLWRQI